ncbi:MAG: carbamoyltransferase HypF [Bacillota bacterium]|nr:carbamoyltransferase HypF [Bacillota bacterium]MDI7249213.1 carbamoyltransferase HypF [Bacillota bacterium]
MKKRREPGTDPTGRLPPTGSPGTGRERWRITVRGTVQGVGFRPFVWHLATSLGLQGWVANAGSGVSIEVEGPRQALDEFASALRAHPPLLARVDEVEVQVLPALSPEPEQGFRIVASRGGPPARVMIPPDLATCPDCRREINDPGDRHYRYPFTNCTRCGPRFTVVTGLPYDRALTTLASFPMCDLCRREYEDPADRRFHAQPTACPQCGPRAWVVDGAGRELPGSWDTVARDLLRAGYIVAVKGMGGYHLACDATSQEAVARLRARKKRPARPFAVMFPDLETLRLYCLTSEAEEELLTSPQAPIVILFRKTEGAALAPAVAPGLDTVGAMLPYTPLHILLLEGLPPLVMTSGNRSGLPIVREEGEALAQLGDIADFFLVHNRPIFRRCDDSVVRVVPLAGAVAADPPRAARPHAYVQVMRRSRGYVPAPVTLPLPPGARRESLPVVAALGAEMKNVVCLTREERAYLSQHLGEMDTVEGVDNLREALTQLASLLGVEPSILAHDLHPTFSLTGLAAGFPPERRVGVQHHHAHLASVLADSGRPGPVVGLVADGVGYGRDGQVWGMEVLVGSLGGFHRAAHLAYVPLPGGEAAIRNPLRMAVSYLRRGAGEEGLVLAQRLFPGHQREVTATWHLCARERLLCSSAGRLFDAVSAVLGICPRNTYEGQAAIELEEEAWRALAGRSPEALAAMFPSSAGAWRNGSGAPVHGGIDPEPAGCPRPVDRPPPVTDASRSVLRWVLDAGPLVVDAAPLVVGMAESYLGSGADPAVRRQLALRFHLEVARLTVEMACRVARREGLDTVALSGGTFQNALLVPLVVAGLERAGLRVLLPRQVPANDGGIALGQAAVAVWKLAGGEEFVPGSTRAGADAGG